MDPTTTMTTSNLVATEWATLIPQVGFGGIIFVAFMFLLRWVLKTQEIILTNAKDERAASQIVIQGYLKVLEQMSIQSNEFHKQVTEAHNYQRNEHEKMLEGLNNVCITTQQHRECLEKIKSNLEEQGKVLVRINGLRHE